MRDGASLAVIVLLSVLISTNVQAACYGSSTFENCYDGSGNTYTVNRFGDTTQMNGFNAQTGSQWSQTSQTYGTMTYHTGMTNGQP